MAMQSTLTRRAMVTGLATAIVGTTLLATGAAGSLASELKADGGAAAARPVARPEVPAGARVGWAATSPATHQGDHYSLVLTNGPTAQRVWVRTMIMDHRTQTNTMVIAEQLQLAANEQRELKADNNYGTANHFQTSIGAESQSLTFQVTLTDSSGAETARFNQRAFMQRTDLRGSQPSQEPMHMH